MKLIKTLSLLWLGVIITSCATVPDTNIEHMKGALPEGNGLVVAETMNNSVRITGPINIWRELVLWKVNSKEDNNNNKTFSISALNGSVSTNLYAGAVPAGTYRIGLLWTTKQLGDVTYYAKALVPPKIGTFEVKPGQVSNLGTLMYHPFSAKSWADRQMPDYAVSRIKNENLWSLIRQNKPKVADKLANGAPVAGWQLDEFATDREKAANLIITAALPTSFQLLNRNTHALLGKAGALYLKKSESKQWKKIDTHSVSAITTASIFSDGKIYVGGESGFFASVDTNLGKIQRFQLPNPLTHILEIDSIGEFNYISTFTGNEFELYEFIPLTKKFKLLKSFIFNPPNFFYSVSRPIILRDSGKLTVYIDTKCYGLRLADKTWSTNECTEYNFLYKQVDGTLIGSPYSAWSGAKPFVYSTDNGLTWAESVESSGLFGRIATPVYRASDNHFLKIGKDAKYEFFGKGWTTHPEVPFLASKDQGKTWIEIGTLPRRCVKLQTQASTDEQLFVLCDNGDLMKSVDLGKSWEQVFSSSKPETKLFPAGLYLKFKKEDKAGN